ncbi:MAG: type III-B CRISPR module-associated protein Cmr3 [Armatimonadetes bacterium]|nr:type III-B CRISPR module-associated protein Cmr3 [Armatimonadota bacterium]
MIGMKIAPMDTLFFRDGTPFSAGSASQEDVGGVFPPHPVTMTGVIRAALARLNGWNGSGRWLPELNQILGDGPEDIGEISVDGPFLVRDDRPLFAAPRHLLGSIKGGQWVPRVLLHPGPVVACDLGDAVRLPVVPPVEGALETLRPGEGWWLTQDGIQTVLRGELPPETEIVPSARLWREERRIGLERDRATRTAREGMLFSTRHVRLMAGVTLGVRVAGVPKSWTLPFNQLVSIGGEGRLAECQKWRAELAIDQPLSMIESNGRAVLIALTPLDLPAEICVGRSLLDALGGMRIVSACLSRPERIGGWDSLNRRPLPLRSVLPPGSVLFCEIDDRHRFHDALAAIGSVPRVGARQRWGFGLVALGSWPGESEVT